MKARLTSSATPSAARLRVLGFLLLWLAYGAAINSSNLVEFDLQQIGVEAMVERGHFYLEGSPSPHMQTKGDVFEYGGHKYPAKQPGQFMAGSVVYFLLHKLGLNYANHYLLTAALVTFFTSSLILAASAVALFEIARALTANNRDSLFDRLDRGPRAGNPRGVVEAEPVPPSAQVPTPNNISSASTRTAPLETSLFWPLAATLGYALATTAFAYSGIAHHDALATGYLVIAFYLIFQLSRESATERASYLRAAGAGLLLGLTVTTSMLPFFMAIVCTVYFFFLRRWRLVPLFLVGLLAGQLPLLVYDAVNFGNPLLLPNVAGHYADTYFHFDPRNFGNKIVFYARALLLYAPIFLLGLFGLSYFPRALKREPHFPAMGAMMIVIAVYVFNIDTVGDYQFGPRYLLPVMPFACLGLVGYSYLSRGSERRWAAVGIMSVGVLSLVINLVGALQGAMCCPEGSNVFLSHVAAIRRGELRSHPLAPWVLVPLAACLVLFIWSLRGSLEAGTARRLKRRR